MFNPWLSINVQPLVINQCSTLGVKPLVINPMFNPWFDISKLLEISNIAASKYQF